MICVWPNCIMGFRKGGSWNLLTKSFPKFLNVLGWFQLFVTILTKSHIQLGQWSWPSANLPPSWDNVPTLTGFGFWRLPLLTFFYQTLVCNLLLLSTVSDIIRRYNDYLMTYYSAKGCYYYNNYKKEVTTWYSTMKVKVKASYFLFTGMSAKYKSSK